MKYRCSKTRRFVLCGEPVNVRCKGSAEPGSEFCKVHGGGGMNVNSITVKASFPDGEDDMERSFIDDETVSAFLVVKKIMASDFPLFLRHLDANTDENGQGEFEYKWENPSQPGFLLTVSRGQIKTEE